MKVATVLLPIAVCISLLVSAGCAVTSPPAADTIDETVIKQITADVLALNKKGGNDAMLDGEMACWDAAAKAAMDPMRCLIRNAAAMTIEENLAIQERRKSTGPYNLHVSVRRMTVMMFVQLGITEEQLEEMSERVRGLKGPIREALANMSAPE